MLRPSRPSHPLAPAVAVALAAAAAIGPASPAGATATGSPGPAGVPAAFAVAPAVNARVSHGTPLPGGRPRYVVSVMGGSYNAYWVRLAQYSFTAGKGGTGTVRQSYWLWNQARFSGTAKQNKVSTGYLTSGCSATCAVRTPKGFQPGAGPMGTLTGRYRFDRYGRLVVEWPGHQVEAWTVRKSGPRLARMTLHHTNMSGLSGDGLGSTASFATGATRNQVAATTLTGVQRVASYGDGGAHPVRTSRWSTNVVAPMQRCSGSGSACLFHTGKAWRTAIVVPKGLGRRAFWQHQRQGNDGDRGACFGSGGGHTVALLQGIDDSGRFAGFVGAEASFNGRSWHNAVVAQLLLT